MLYEFKLNHSAAEAARNLALAFGSESPSERTVRCWFAKFASGDFDLEGRTGRGRRVSLDDEALRAAVESKPDTTTRVLAADFGVHHTTSVKHLASIGMVKKIQKWTHYAESYCCDWDLMYEKLRPAVVNRSGPVLLQDNASSHSSKLTREKLTQ
ncbi:hypothetical protein Y032_0036g3223 [Ancylostoma ceylanicum]|uniref:Mos1 transposase HTH domain-containing protein n=1 Tax=Ancylostoma ceylanicum TaxID=53326 RepID=A0A016UL15_9BILA|nr:hypothetical protein Y032_0036g3223 [Ancylostoma ceylanicum]